MAWSVLQSASATNGGSGNVAVQYGTNLTAGTKLIALVAVSASTTPYIVSGMSDGTNSLTLLASKLSASFSVHAGLYALDCPSGDAGTKPVITATIGTNFGASIVIQEVSGLLAGNTSAMLDGTPATATGTASPATTGAYSSAASGEYLVCGYGDPGYSVSLTTPSGYTADPHNVGSNSLAECGLFYKNSGGAAESASITLSGTATWDTILAAFQLAPSGTDSGPNSPSTGTDLGGGTGSWTSPGNVTADDGADAVWTVV